MAKKKVFLSFDFNDDSDLKNQFLKQAKHPDSPFSVNDYSLREAYPNDEWVAKAQSAISKCNLFIVLLGNNTHQAPGVITEVGIATGLKKKCFQLKPQRRNPKPVANAGEVVSWRWKNLREKWS